MDVHGRDVAAQLAAEGIQGQPGHFSWLSQLRMYWEVGEPRPWRACSCRPCRLWRLPASGFANKLPGRVAAACAALRASQRMCARSCSSSRPRNIASRPSHRSPPRRAEQPRHAPLARAGQRARRRTWRQGAHGAHDVRRGGVRLRVPGQQQQAGGDAAHGPLLPHAHGRHPPQPGRRAGGVRATELQQ
jgi:hypothetical protein